MTVPETLERDVYIPAFLAKLLYTTGKDCPSASSPTATTPKQASAATDALHAPTTPTRAMTLGLSLFACRQVAIQPILRGDSIAKLKMMCSVGGDSVGRFLRAVLCLPVTSPVGLAYSASTKPPFAEPLSDSLSLAPLRPVVPLLPATLITSIAESSDVYTDSVSETQPGGHSLPPSDPEHAASVAAPVTVQALLQLQDLSGGKEAGLGQSTNVRRATDSILGITLYELYPNWRRQCQSATRWFCVLHWCTSSRR
ncbi:hypothetical protein BJX70DRAFT_397229 [Aspergillus crustosus]